MVIDSGHPAFIKLLGIKLDPTISTSRHVTNLVQSCNYHTAHSSIANAGICKHGCAWYCGRTPWLLQPRSSMACPVIISGRCRWHRMRWPELHAKLQEHAVLQLCHNTLHWLPVNETTHRLNKLAVLTYKARQSGSPSCLASVINEYAPSRSLISRTNCCLAVLKRFLSWLTKHFLLVLQRFGMTCLLTAMLQRLWIVVCQMHLTDYLITLVCLSVYVCVCPQIGCRTITSAILHRFSPNFARAWKYDRLDRYCFWDKPEVDWRF